jgi:hypothetical protein
MIPYFMLANGYNLKGQFQILRCSIYSLMLCELRKPLLNGSANAPRDIYSESAEKVCMQVLLVEGGRVPY